MEQLKKKRSRVSKSRNACNRAKIAGHKEQMTLKQLSDAFGSVTMREAASALPAKSASREDEHLPESNSNATSGNQSIVNVLTFDLRGQHVELGIKILKSHLCFGALLRLVGSFRFITGRASLKTSIINFLKEEGIQWSEEDQGTTLVIGFTGQTNFSFLYDSESD